MKSYLLIRHMLVHDANAMSSTLTIGVPAVTAWMGAVHALERKVRQKEPWKDIAFNGAGISFHRCSLQVHKGVGDSCYSIIGTANPLRKKVRDLPLLKSPVSILTYRFWWKWKDWTAIMMKHF